MRTKSSSRNSFDEIRFFLAFIVVMAHTQALVNHDSLYWLTKHFDSDFAVKGFFAISGYLVTKSFYTSNSTKDFFEKRARRILPAYILVILYCFLIGLLTTSIPTLDFLKTGETWKYFLSNLAFLNFVQPSLPGVFTSNEIQAMNGSLWTIKVEVMLYFLVPMIVFFYTKIGANFTFVIAFSIGLIWYTVFSYFVDHRLSDVLARQFIGQLPYFALGSFLTFFDLKRKSFIYLGMISLLYLFTKKFIPGHISEYLNMLFYPLLVLTLANTNYLNLGIGKFGDLSFGIYLFHFPTIQLLVHLGLYDLNPYIGLLISVGLTLSLAAFSWNYVEKKFLKRSSHYIEAAKQ